MGYQQGGLWPGSSGALQKCLPAHQFAQGSSVPAAPLESEMSLGGPVCLTLPGFPTASPVSPEVFQFWANPEGGPPHLLPQPRPNLCNYGAAAVGHVLGGIGGGGLGRPQAQPAVGTLGGVLAKRRLELDLGGECGRWMERGLFQPKCRGSRPLAQEVSTQGQVVVWVEITKDALTLGFILWAVASAGALAISRGALLALSLSPQNRGPGTLAHSFLWEAMLPIAWAH